MYFSWQLLHHSQCIRADVFLSIDVCNIAKLFALMYFCLSILVTFSRYFHWCFFCWQICARFEILSFVVLLTYCCNIASDFVPKELFLHQSVSILPDRVRNVFSGERDFQECQRHKPRMLWNCWESKVLMISTCNIYPDILFWNSIWHCHCQWDHLSGNLWNISK